MVVTAEKDIEAAAEAARCVVETHAGLVGMLRPGITLPQIDEMVAGLLADLGAKSAFLRYRIRGHPPYPSHSCLSPNDCIVHGTHLMSRDPLAEGDLISVDVGAVKQGWIGDAAWTYALGSASEEALALMRAGRESLRRGIAAIHPGRPLADWARAVQGYVEGEAGFHLVRGLGGHGYGRSLHGPPFVSNVMPEHAGEWPDAWTTFRPGTLIAVEPMLGATTGAMRSEPRTWPIFTADGGLAVHYEADVLVTEEGVRNLTAPMMDLPDVVG